MYHCDVTLIFDVCRCDPFVLYYKKLELVMNFSVYGNDARFIRRSCSPTAEVSETTRYSETLFSSVILRAQNVLVHSKN